MVSPQPRRVPNPPRLSGPTNRNPPLGHARDRGARILDRTDNFSQAGLFAVELHRHQGLAGFTLNIFNAPDHAQLWFNDARERRLAQMDDRVIERTHATFLSEPGCSSFR